MPIRTTSATNAANTARSQRSFGATSSGLLFMVISLTITVTKDVLLLIQPVQSTSDGEWPVKLLNPAGLYDSSPNAYSQLAIVPPGRRLVFISGQGGDNPDGSFSPDFAAQAASAFRNLGIAIAAAGANLADV